MKRFKDLAMRLRPRSESDEDGFDLSDLPILEPDFEPVEDFATALGNRQRRPVAVQSPPPDAEDAPSEPDSSDDELIRKLQIWDLEDDAEVDASETVAQPRQPRKSLAQRSLAALPETSDDAPDQVERVLQAEMPNRGREAPRSRAKTRIIGFHSADIDADPMAGPARAASQQSLFPAGWLVVIDGPGRGTAFAICAGVSTIGRGADQSISLDFGDQSISRSNHASVAYDEEQNRFFVGHGGKSNVVRRNGNPVLSTEDLAQDDVIRIGQTSLRFVALCGPDFTWAEDTAGEGTQNG